MKSLYILKSLLAVGGAAFAVFSLWSTGILLRLGNATSAAEPRPAAAGVHVVRVPAHLVAPDPEQVRPERASALETPPAPEPPEASDLSSLDRQEVERRYQDAMLDYSLQLEAVVQLELQLAGSGSDRAPKTAPGEEVLTLHRDHDGQKRTIHLLESDHPELFRLRAEIRELNAELSARDALLTADH